MLLTHWGSKGCNMAAAMVNRQVTEPEPICQVFRLLTCVAMGELVQGGSKVRPPVSRFEPMLMSMVAPIDVC